LRVTWNVAMMGGVCSGLNSPGWLGPGKPDGKRHGWRLGDSNP
jgi:hypothetical protein